MRPLIIQTFGRPMDLEEPRSARKLGADFASHQLYCTDMKRTLTEGHSVAKGQIWRDHNMNITESEGHHAAFQPKCTAHRRDPECRSTSTPAVLVRLARADLCRSRAMREGNYLAQSCLRSRPNEGSSDSAFVCICTIGRFCDQRARSNECQGLGRSW